MDVLDRADLPFPHSLPEFQRLFPDDAACATYVEKARWIDVFVCPHCGITGEPFRFENRPGILRCRTLHVAVVGVNRIGKERSYWSSIGGKRQCRQKSNMDATGHSLWKQIEGNRQSLAIAADRHGFVK